MTGLAQGAAMLCQNPRVWGYINHLMREPICKHPEHARDFMYSEFGIQSRKDLEVNPEARGKYLAFVKSFNDWLNPPILIPKRYPYRCRELLDAANGSPCVRCGAVDGTVVAAHAQGMVASWFGKGMACKPDDYAVAELCSTCHRLMDSYHDGNNPQYTLEWLKLVLLTHERWFRDAVILPASQALLMEGK